MMGVSVEERGSETWLALWERTGREPFAHPAYVALEARAGGDPVALCWGDDGGEVLLPLVLRPLPDQPWLAELAAEGWRDAVSPYGYGGPFLAGAPNLDAFVADLLAWMREARLLTGFVRASLGVTLPDPGAVEGYEALHLADNVVVDLGRSPEEQWRTYEHKVRKNVNKARRHGLQVEVRDSFADLDGFLGVYHQTMQRRGADEGYYFDAEYFGRIGAEMAGSFWVADVLDEDGRTVSTELVLTGERTCYSFLGGTIADAFPMAPNDLLKHAVIEHAAACGLRGFVLGGGYQPGDGIFRYKKAFDPAGVVPFSGVRLTADPAAYRRACAARPGAEPGAFFPAYRAP